MRQSLNASTSGEVGIGVVCPQGSRAIQAQGLIVHFAIVLYHCLLMAAAAQQASPAITAMDVRQALVGLLVGRDLNNISVKEMRQELAVKFALPADGLDGRKSEIRDIIQQVVQDIHGGQLVLKTEDLGVEDPKTAKACYLVTLPHPKMSYSQDGIALKAPSSYTKQEIVQAFLAAMNATNSGRLQDLNFSLLCDFREKHANGEFHDHMATKAQRSFRFMPLKRYLLMNYGLATHWSCSHEGYHTCISYGYEPSDHKPLAELDPAPEMWALEGLHPPLDQACKGSVTANAIRDHHEKIRRKKLETNKVAKFEDIDLWPVVIRENIVDSPLAAEVLMGYAKRCGGEAMVKFCFRQWDKLPQLIQRCWRVELVETYVEKLCKSRVDTLKAALQTPCICGGHWGPMALELLHDNGIRWQDWCDAMMHSMMHGRSKGTLVCHAGFEGNEGKSFLFEPLGSVFGEDMVFSSPPKGGFPLMGLERCQLCLLDDWRFNEDLLSYPLQLLWFEGKPIIIARPQNQYVGHLKYTADAPIFISTLMADITKIKGKKIEGGDVEMMLKRLKLFKFSQVLTNPMKVPACGRCFATLLFQAPCMQSQQPGLARQASVSGPAVGCQASLCKHGSALPAGGQPPAKRRCSTWNVEDVVAYIKSLGLGHVEDKFRDNAIDGQMLIDTPEDELRSELGLLPLQARKIRARLPI